LRAQYGEYSQRDSPPPHPALIALTHIKQAYAATMFIATGRNSEGPGVNVVCLRDQYGERLNARQSTAASHSVVWISTHQTHTNLDGDRVKTGNLEGGFVKSPSRGPIWRNTQCEAVHRRILLYSCSNTSCRHMLLRRSLLPYATQRARG